MNRNLQIYLQKKGGRATIKEEWRPSAICISRHTFRRNNALKLLDWISYKYGFGTYLHLIDGYFSRETNLRAEEELQRCSADWILPAMFTSTPSSLPLPLPLSLSRYRYRVSRGWRITW